MVPAQAARSQTTQGEQCPSSRSWALPVPGPRRSGPRRLGYVCLAPFLTSRTPGRHRHSDLAACPSAPCASRSASRSDRRSGVIRSSLRDPEDVGGSGATACRPGDSTRPKSPPRRLRTLGGAPSERSRGEFIPGWDVRDARRRQGETRETVSTARVGDGGRGCRVKRLPNPRIYRRAVSSRALRSTTPWSPSCVSAAAPRGHTPPLPPRPSATPTGSHQAGSPAPAPEVGVDRSPRPGGASITRGRPDRSSSQEPWITAARASTPTSLHRRGGAV